MKKRVKWACVWLLLVSYIPGCAEAPKPAEPETPAPVRIASPPDFSITFAALSPDGDTLAYGLCPVPAEAPAAPKGGTGQVVLCEAHTGKERFRLPGRESHYPRAAAFSPDGKLLVVDDASSTVVVWDLTAKKKCSEPLGGVPIDQARPWSPDSTLLVGSVLRVSPKPGYEIRLWSAVNADVVQGLRMTDSGEALAFAFAADGKAVAVEHRQTTIVREDRVDGRDTRCRFRFAIDLWDVATGQRLGPADAPSAWVEDFHDRPPKSRFYDIGAFRTHALAGDHYLLLPAYSDPALSLTRLGGVIVLSDALAGKEVRRLEDFKTGGINSAMLSANGNTVAAAGQAAIGRSDTAAMIWDVSDLIRAERRADAGLSAEQLGPLWGALADRDAAKAFPAMRLLALNPDRTVPILKERLRPADDRPVPKLLTDLGADDFETRGAASRGLAALGESARPALEKALASDPGPEARRRIEELLEKLTDGLGAEVLRGVRSVDVLEQVGTAAARDVLKDLAAGAAGALTTQAAKDALARLEKAPTP